MKLAFDRKTFAETIARVAKFTPSRSPKPILSSILLDASAPVAGEVSFSATNLETTLKTTLGAEVEQPGKCLLHAGRILAITQSATGDQLSIESTDSGALVRSGRGKWELDSEKSEEFPSVNTEIKGVASTHPAKAFMDAARMAGIATDAASSRYALAGVLFESDGNSLALVGTDGRRLTVVRLPIICPVMNGIVPKASLAQLAAGLIEAGDISFQMDATWFRAETVGCVGMTRLMEGRFPKWGDVVQPYQFTAEYTLNSAALSSAVQQVAVTSGEVEEASIELFFSNGALALSSKSAGIGKSETEMPIQYGGERILFYCRPAYLREFLRAAGDKEMQFAFAGIDKDTASSLSLSFDSTQYILMGLSKDR